MATPAHWSLDAACAAASAAGVTLVVGAPASGRSTAVRALAAELNGTVVAGLELPEQPLLVCSWAARQPTAGDPRAAAASLASELDAFPIVVDDGHLLGAADRAALVELASSNPIVLAVAGAHQAAAPVLQAAQPRLRAAFVVDTAPPPRTLTSTHVSQLQRLEQPLRAWLLTAARSDGLPRHLMTEPSVRELVARGLLVVDERNLVPPRAMTRDLLEDALADDGRAADEFVLTAGADPVAVVRSATALGRWDVAEQSAEQVHRVGPPGARAEVARLMAVAGRGETARAAALLVDVGRYRDALKLDPDPPTRTAALAGLLDHAAAADDAEHGQLARLRAWPGLQPDTETDDPVGRAVTALLRLDRGWDGVASAAMAESVAAERYADAVAVGLVLATGQMLLHGAGTALRTLDELTSQTAAWSAPHLQDVVATARCLALVVTEAAATELVSPPLRELAVSGLVPALRVTTLADTGRSHDALSLLADLPQPTTPAGAALIAWASAETEFAAGRPARVLAADPPVRHAPLDPVTDANWLVRAWAAIEEDPSAVPPPSACHGAAALELTALHTWTSDSRAARPAFAEAAAAWRGRSRRAELRCRWAMAAAAARSDAVDEARLELTALEQEAEALELRPLVARCRTTLRQTGLVLHARGATHRSLTRREQQVLELVGEGLTTHQIAVQLAVAPSTVETHVRAGIRKLGARTRVEAAVVLREGTE